MEILTPLTVTACLCAFISASSLSLAVFELIQRVNVEKDEAPKELPILIKMFLPFTGNLMEFVSRPIFRNTRQITGERIMMAGYDQEISAERLIAVQLLSGATGVLVAFLSVFLAKQPVLGILVLLVLLIYPKVWLNKTIRKRHLEIQKALPNVLDLLTLSVEAGKDFLTALRDILLRRRTDALGEELERTFREIQLGKPRRDALKDLSRRVRQPDLSAVLNAIVQADELGVSIGQILRIQGDQFRGKRFQRAEKLANEAPVKILFPLALFILPAVVIILMGPIFIKGFSFLLQR